MPVFCILSNLNQKKNYVRMLLIIFNFTFNIPDPSRLILNFPTGRAQEEKVRHHFFGSLPLFTGAMSSHALLYSLHIHDFNIICRFAADTTWEYEFPTIMNILKQQDLLRQVGTTLYKSSCRFYFTTFKHAAAKLAEGHVVSAALMQLSR